MASKGFDAVAAVYDELAHFVYGKSITDAQTYFLTHIPQQAKVLILGGGTGWILKAIENTETVCEIWYIDASEKMIQLSKGSRNLLHMHFIHGTEKDIPAGIQFDVVITNFYLDLFSEESLKTALETIRPALGRKVQWIATDFVDSKGWWKLLLLKSMYFFFRITCNIEAKKLPDWNKALQIAGFIKKKSHFFYRGFIETTVYGTGED